MKIAVIGIGSNSLRMLLTEVKGKRFERLKRYRSPLRVFAALDSSKRISNEMIENACKEIMRFMQEARNDGAEKFYLFATSAVRDASNQEEFTNRIFTETGLRLDICTGSKEAMLSYLGAVQTEGLSGLIDIGGGSTEIAIGHNEQLLQSDSLQIGAVRLWKQYTIQSAEDTIQLVDMLTRQIKEAKRTDIAYADIQWTGVGGTLTTAAAILQDISWNRKEKIHGFHIEVEALQQITRCLANMTQEERLQFSSIQPQRSDIIVHGLCILEACFQAFELDGINVSEYGNLEGYIRYTLQKELWS